MGTTVSSKGQVTIPKRVRDALGLRRGSRVQFLLQDGGAILTPISGSVTDATAGCLSRYAKGHTPAQAADAEEKMRKEVADAAAKEGLRPRHKRAR